MQRETGLWPIVSVGRSRATLRHKARSSPLIAGALLTAVVFGVSLIFEDALATVGITPASVLLLAVLVGFAASCGSDPLHPARILAVLLAMGFVVGPIFHAATGIYALPDGAERQRARLERATWMVLAGGTLSMLAMRITLGDSWRRDLQSLRKNTLSTSAFRAGIAVAAVGLVILGAYLALVGVSSVSLQGRGETYAAIPHEGRKAYLNLLAPIGLGGLMVVAAWCLERRSRLSLFFVSSAALGFGGLLALPGSRANFLYAVAPLFFLYGAYRMLPRWQWLLGGTTALILLLSYGSSLRTPDARSALIRDPWRTLSENQPTAQSLERLFVVDIAHTEPLLGAMDAFPSTRPFLGGESAAVGFTGPAGWRFGRSIGLHFDPPAGVTLTAVAYGRDPSSFGAGLTATFPGELYANGGVIGVLLGLASFGAVAGWIRRRAVLSSAPGVLPLYAAGITVLFAIFSDYIGQFYRCGFVAVGVAISLILSRENTFSVVRNALVAVLIAIGAAGLLIARRLLGPPSAALLTSLVPVQVSLIGLFIFFTVRVIRDYPWQWKSAK